MDDRERPCVVCGAVVTAVCVGTNGAGLPAWQAVAHRAPCGARCVGGGITRADAKEDRCGIREAVARAHGRGSCGTPGCTRGAA